MRLTAGRTVMVHPPFGNRIEVGFHSPKVGLVTHVLHDRARIRVFLSNPGDDLVIDAPMEPYAKSPDGWCWTWPPRES